MVDAHGMCAFRRGRGWVAMGWRRSTQISWVWGGRERVGPGGLGGAAGRNALSDSDGTIHPSSSSDPANLTFIEYRKGRNDLNSGRQIRAFPYSTPYLPTSIPWIADLDPHDSRPASHLRFLRTLHIPKTRLAAQRRHCTVSLYSSWSRSAFASRETRYGDPPCTVQYHLLHYGDIEERRYKLTLPPPPHHR